LQKTNSNDGDDMEWGSFGIVTSVTNRLKADLEEAYASISISIIEIKVRKDSLRGRTEDEVLKPLIDTIKTIRDKTMKNVIQTQAEFYPDATENELAHVKNGIIREFHNFINKIRDEQ